MSSPTRSAEDRPAPESRARWSTRALSAGALAVSALVGTLVLSGAPGRAATQLRTSGAPASSQESVDLRCLTRRPDDCLAEPVPADEPHGAICSTCHDLWDDRARPDHVRSCASSGCHEDPLSLSPFHVTLEAAVLGDCGHCHVAHDFRAPTDGRACSACHTGGGARVAWAGGRPLRTLAAPTGVPFAHATHTGVACAACHGTLDGHGTLKVTTGSDCRTCHHATSRRDECGVCHSAADIASLDLHVSRELSIEIGSVVRPVRWLPFDHNRHEDTACSVCHTEGTDLATGAAADCSTCHAEHHDPEADCATCHARPSDGAHDPSAHLGCTGSGCHVAPSAIANAPRTRELCLACHRDLADHRPGRTCSDCHKLPQATGEPRAPR